MMKHPGLTEVRQRRMEISNLRAELVRQVDALRDEDSELETVEKVLARLAGENSTDELLRNTPVRQRGPAPKNDVEASETFVDAVDSIMRASERVWWTAVELRGELSKRWNRDVPQTSISPKLSKMKDEGKIVRDGMKIALPERTAKDESFLPYKENEPPKGGSETGEAATSPKDRPFGLNPHLADLAPHSGREGGD